jgi:hypothetical protein
MEQILLHPGKTHISTLPKMNAEENICTEER